MSLNRYAKKTDQSQAPIVEALREVGFHVWVIGWPCDLLIWRIDKGFRVLECKTPYNKDGSQKKRKDQQKQIEFLQLTGCPIALDPEQALRALGVV